MQLRVMSVAALVAIAGGLLLPAATTGGDALPSDAERADSGEFALLGERRDWLHENLLEQITVQAAERQRAVEQAIKSVAGVEARREVLRGTLTKLVGDLPERTPLNARTTGTIECQGYRIERVVYESRPGHHVTANLYLPANATGRVPGVLVPCGHSDNGKASAAYQSACVLLALNGCAALIYDPIGQGERNQLPNPTKHGTNEHTLVGVGALAVGWNTANYRIWDGLRSIDYLASRTEVDATRLGCTGNSGGGTMTTWLMALDDRIECAAPSCFITTVERLFKTIGPQDCEQHFPRQGLHGIDHTDFITMRAPRPTLILAAEKDFFDIAGTRQAANEATAVYRVLGRPERVGLFTYDDPHGFSQPRRLAAVHWLRRWLLDDDRPVVEPELTLQSDAALQVTASGQVVGEFEGERTVVDLAVERAELLTGRRAEIWKSLGDQQRIDTIAELLGISLKKEPKATVRRLAKIAWTAKEDRLEYTAEPLVLERVGRVPLPALLCLPSHQGDKNKKLPVVIYADSKGKHAGLRPSAMGASPIKKLLSEGNAVLSIDLSGYGETADSKKGGQYLNDEFRTAMLAMHVGQPLVGRRAADLLAAVDALAEEAAVDSKSIRLIGVDRAALAALHVATIDSRFTTVELRGGIESWASDVVAKPLTPNLLGQVVPGALKHYDLPQLREMLGERLVGK